MDIPDQTTAEGRLESFCRALENHDEALFPENYRTEDHTPFCADMREVLAKVKAAAVQ
jgi:hypothetical protein